MRQFGREVGLFVVVCAAGCGGGGGGTAVRLEDAATCKPAWQPLTAAQPFDVTSGLVYQAGTVYYSGFHAKAVLAVPTDGSPVTTLAPVATEELWVEDDHLLFPGGDLANQIFALPLSGGTPLLVLDGGAGRAPSGVAMAHAFNATDFYWVERNGAPTSGIGNSTVWRQARADGMPIELGTTTFTDPSGADYPGTAIALSGESVVVGSAFGEAATVPIAGGYMAPLALPAASPERNVQADLAGIDALGAYWALPQAPGQRASLTVSPADGSAATSFWPTLPASAEPIRIWPNPEGGWIVASFQLFADGINHMTIWSIDAQGSAVRLACSPGSGGDSWIEKGVAVAPDAVYVAAENLSAGTWQIDRIAR